MGVEKYCTFFLAGKGMSCCKNRHQSLVPASREGKKWKNPVLSVASCFLAVAYCIQSIDILGYQVQKERVGEKKYPEGNLRISPLYSSQIQGRHKKSPPDFSRVCTYHKNMFLSAEMIFMYRQSVFFFSWICSNCASVILICVFFRAWSDVWLCFPMPHHHIHDLPTGLTESILFTLFQSSFPILFIYFYAIEPSQQTT